MPLVARGNPDDTTAIVAVVVEARGCSHCSWLEVEGVRSLEHVTGTSARSMKAQQRHECTAPFFGECLCRKADPPTATARSNCMTSTHM